MPHHHHQLPGAPTAFVSWGGGPPGALIAVPRSGPLPRLVPSHRLISAESRRRAEDCVIVNPLAPLGPSAVTSGYSEGPLGLLPCPGEEQQEGSSMVSCSQGKEQGEEVEPIYAEIKVPVQTVQDEEKEVVVEEEKAMKKNKLAAVDGGGGKKKGVEYWQITTKEMTKFRPCTQVIIRR